MLFIFNFNYFGNGRISAEELILTMQFYFIMAPFLAIQKPNFLNNEEMAVCYLYIYKFNGYGNIRISTENLNLTMQFYFIMAPFLVNEKSLDQKK